MASIEQHGPSWRVVWRHNGVKQRTTWASRELAEEVKAVVEAHRGKRTSDQVYVEMGVLDPDPQSTAPTLRDWCDRWLKAKTRLTPGTRAGYERQLVGRIYPVLGDVPIDRITPTQIGNLLNALRDPEDEDEPGLKNTTVTRYYSLLHAALDGAVRERILTANPASLTDYVRDQTEHDDTGEPGQVRLTPAEYKTLLTAFGAEDQPLIELLAGTGARWSEATALSIAHIVPPTDKAPPKVRIWRAWKRDGKGGWYLGTTKGRRRREIAISRNLYLTLRPLIADRPGEAFLFTAPAGGPVHYSNFLQRRWNPALAEAGRCAEHPPPNRGEPRPAGGAGRARCRDFGGTNDRGQPCGALAAAGWTRCRDHQGPAPEAVSTCDCADVLRRRPTPHDLRHTHAAWLFSDPRVTPLAISRRLGHAQLSTTSEIYGDLMPEAEESAVAALDDALA
jgi:integrase